MSGQGGVEKDHLTNIIYQSISKALQYHDRSPNRPRNLLFTPSGVASININAIQDGLFQGCSQLPRSLPQVCRTYPTMMKLGTDIPYLMKTEKTYESRDTLLGFC